jgi:predicted ATPase/DNA-binding SARP family transcriptional activator
VEVRVLGGVSLHRDGVELAIGGRRPQALLALLAIHRGRPVLLEALIDQLWPEEPPDSAAKTIQVYVSRLRAALGDERDRLASRTGGYELRAAAADVDATAFADGVETARRLLASDDPDGSLVELDAALARWRGRPFGDLADEAFLRAETRRLEDLHAAARELRADALVRGGRADEAVAELRALVGDEPTREPAWSRLVLALYATGRQADALAAYHEIRDRLDDELGIEPGADLEAAHLAVLRQSAPGPAVAASRVATTASTVPDPGIHAEGIRPIGRDEEIAAIERALTDGARLVTLVGPGGIGKTTLWRTILEGQARMGARVAAVELEGVPNADAVPAAVETVLGGTGDAADQIGEDTLLLGLDNLEHLLDSAGWIARLVQHCPALRVLVTSRESLRLDAETVLPVGPLSPDAARKLFLDRARRVRPTLEDSGEVDDVCERLDRLPLAIELAAARTSLLSVRALLGRLDRTLDTLGATGQDHADRQRTLRSTIAWSYDLLEPDLRTVFRGLSVFAGGFGIEAAEAVTGALLDDLEKLRSASLMTVRYEPEEPRFALLETIRAFAAEQLESDPDEARAVHARHAAWATRVVARSADAGLRHDLPELTRELDNLRAAMAWALATGDHETRLRIAVGLSDVWQTRGHFAEARRWLELDIDAVAVPDELRAEAYDDAASIALRQGDSHSVERLSQRLLVLAERLDQPGRRVAALAKLAQVRLRADDLEGARELHAQAMTIAATEADRRPLLVSITGQANADLLAGRLDLAVPAFESVVAMTRDVGRPESVATAWFNLGLARVLDGRARGAARAALREALDRYVALEDPEGVGYVLVALAASIVDDDPRSAATALGAAEATLRMIGAELEAVEARVARDTRARLRTLLDDGALEAAMNAGATLEPDERRRLAERALEGESG